jgi:hypothetical protein
MTIQSKTCLKENKPKSDENHYDDDDEDDNDYDGDVR